MELKLDYQSRMLFRLVLKHIFYYRDQTWFFMHSHSHSPGPEGGVKNRGQRAEILIPSKGPGEC